MPTANHDSSYITLLRKQQALYGYYNQLQAAQAANNNVRQEQPSQELLSVITDRKQGGCVCSTSNVYNFNPNGQSGAIN
jgi:hypothetical protein